MPNNVLKIKWVSNSTLLKYIKMSSDVWTKEQMDGKPSSSL
jgi:hypothetical protein